MVRWEKEEGGNECKRKEKLCSFLKAQENNRKTRTYSLDCMSKKKKNRKSMERRKTKEKLGESKSQKRKYRISLFFLLSFQKEEFVSLLQALGSIQEKPNEQNTKKQLRIRTKKRRIPKTDPTESAEKEGKKTKRGIVKKQRKGKRKRAIIYEIKKYQLQLSVPNTFTKIRSLSSNNIF